MKQTYVTTVGTFLLGLTLNSCIQEEAPNAEADITACSLLPVDCLASNTIEVGLPYSDELNAYPIEIKVKEGTDLSSLAPTFELTPGATISPESGSIHDFSSPVRYTVTSEDRQWHRTYSVSVTEQTSTNIPTVYHFENIKTSGNYYVFYEQQGEHSLTWASGNGGYALAVSQAAAKDYPTTQDDNGWNGKCLKLVTRSTGSLGSLVGMPIAAGNLFIGQFDLTNALTAPLKATKFGIPFYSKPIRLTGYYKYKAGEQFFANGAYTDQKDVFDIYAFFFDNSNGTSMLDGSLPSNGYTHPDMIAVARIKDAHETDEWTSFSLNFDYDSFGKGVDAQKLAEGKYSLGIVMSSSKDGASFEGAPGSTLLIDEMELIFE